MSFFDKYAESLQSNSQRSQECQEYPKYEDIEDGEIFATFHPEEPSQPIVESQIVRQRSQNPQILANRQTQMLFGTQPRLRSIASNLISSQEKIQFPETNEVARAFLTQFSQFPDPDEVWPDPKTQQEINEVFQDQQDFQEDVFQYENICGSQDFEMNEIKEPELPKSLEESRLPDSSTLSQEIFSTQYSQSIKAFSQQIPAVIESNLQGVPTSILRFFEASRQNSTDWTFVYSLAAQLSYKIYPMNSYMNLKLSLLLSIASVGPDPKKAPMPIVAVGLNAGDASAIMNQVANLANRFVNALVDITGATINKDNCIEAGPLLLAKSGVCYLGDWAMKRVNDSQQVLRGMADILFKITVY